MIDTEKIKADIELGRKTILPTQSVAAQSLIYNARSNCVRHAADLLEERDHLLHPSQGEVVTYQSRIDELAAAATQFYDHSVILNRICWKIAEELGEVPDGQGKITTDPEALVDRLVSRLRGVRALCETNERVQNDPNPVVPVWAVRQAIGSD